MNTENNYSNDLIQDMHKDFLECNFDGNILNLFTKINSELHHISMLLEESSKINLDNSYKIVESNVIYLMDILLNNTSNTIKVLKKYNICIINALEDVIYKKLDNLLKKHYNQHTAEMIDIWFYDKDKNGEVVLFLTYDKDRKIVINSIETLVNFCNKEYNAIENS